MAKLKFEDVGITAMAAAVPENTIKNLEYTKYFTPESVRQVVEKIGVYERRFAEPGVCASDMCYSAAEKLITDNDLDRNEIDLLIFVSQTPDYRMPATSVILQERLGLSKETITFDLNLGCSGFIYGLATVYSMLERSGLRKALLLDGETRSRIYSPQDRQSAFLFGDGGAAALVEKMPGFGTSYFTLNSDGSKEHFIKMKAGGYRYPSSPETKIERVVDKNGNVRSDEHGYILGSDVFTFVIKEIPADIRRVMEYSGNNDSDIDYYVLHQANLFINTHLIRKLKLNKDKVPSSIGKFGNTSSVSIPLTMVSELQGKLDRSRVLMSGFGVGMTWASCLLDMNNCKISELVEI